MRKSAESHFSTGLFDEMLSFPPSRIGRALHSHSIPVAPGCYSPTEVLTGWEAGADCIRLFPASVGGPSLVKAILAPLPALDLTNHSF
jgi:2-dehydro-3-deoxyphosphogluconate aldolase/(4S)-4-hydroxy-2-oxoglutarate aldolase